MHGQWIGSVELPNGAVRAILNIDADRPNEFMFHVVSDAKSIGLLAVGEWQDDAIELRPSVIFRRSEIGALLAPAEADLTEEERSVRDGTTISLSRSGREITGNWQDIAGASGQIKLPSSGGDCCADPFMCTSWDEFKQWAARIRRQNELTLFRGHGSSKFRLQTTLHRAGRFRLDRYWNETVPLFRDRAEAVMGVRFDQSSGDDQAIVLGLAQHHGLPTPLLDVTASPYIAAFFAFSDVVETQRDLNEHPYVRVYAFTRKFAENLAAPNIAPAYADIFVNTLSIGSRFNPRLYAQQGKFVVTNIASLEHLLRYLEGQMNERVMYAADVPAKFASEALEDLAFMGLTAANMFPGLDGVGRMMRHEMLFSRKDVASNTSQQDSKPISPSEFGKP